MAVDSTWLNTALRAVAKSLKAYPLREIAVAASFWIPLTVTLRWIAGIAGVESLIEKAVAPWSFAVMGAGLAFLWAHGLSIASRSRSRKVFRNYLEAARTRATEKLAKAELAKDKRMLDALSGLEHVDRELLKIAVDRRDRDLHGHGIQFDRDALARLSNLGWIDVRVYEGRRTVTVEFIPFGFLLRNPNAVGSEKPPTEVV